MNNKDFNDNFFLVKVEFTRKTMDKLTNRILEQLGHSWDHTNHSDKVKYIEVPSFTLYGSKQDMRRKKLDLLLNMMDFNDAQPFDEKQNLLRFFGLSRVDGHPIFRFKKNSFGENESIKDRLCKIFGDEINDIQLVTPFEDHVSAFSITNAGKVGLTTTSKLPIPGIYHL